MQILTCAILRGRSLYLIEGCLLREIKMPVNPRLVIHHLNTHTLLILRTLVLVYLHTINLAQLLITHHYNYYTHPTYIP